MKGRLNHTNERALFITALVSNIGSPPTKIIYGKSYIQQVSPLDVDWVNAKNDPLHVTKNKIAWPKLDEKESYPEIQLRSGESDQLEFEFIVPSNVSVFRVYVEIKSDGKDPLVWHSAKTFEVKDLKL